MKKLLLASIATLSITAAGVGATADNHTADAAETTTQETGNSVYNQFINAGGTKAMWDNIVLPESGGNPNAVNELGYRGLGQTKEAWGSGSVAVQTKGMIHYAKQRYGSINGAIQFRQAHGWW